MGGVGVGPAERTLSLFSNSSRPEGDRHRRGGRKEGPMKKRSTYASSASSFVVSGREKRGREYLKENSAIKEGKRKRERRKEGENPFSNRFLSPSPYFLLSLFSSSALPLPPPPPPPPVWAAAVLPPLLLFLAFKESPSPLPFLESGTGAKFPSLWRRNLYLPPLSFLHHSKCGRGWRFAAVAGGGRLCLPPFFASFWIASDGDVVSRSWKEEEEGMGKEGGGALLLSPSRSQPASQPEEEERGGNWRG